ncbi:ribonuclease H-like domain-containing protein, partial [Tanacetum coccineum]
MPIWKDASYFDSPSKDVGNDEQKSAADDQKQVEDGPDNQIDEKDKFKDDSSPKEVNAAGQHVNNVSPEVNNGCFKLNTVDPSVEELSAIQTPTGVDTCGFAVLERGHWNKIGLRNKKDERGTVIRNKERNCVLFEKLIKIILNKFNYTDVKSASTPVDLEKTLVKDGDANDVDRFPFELVAYTDSDYARATQDRKSTTGGCQFLGNRLISWQCKKQTVVATSTTEAENVADAVAADLSTKGFDAGRFPLLVSSKEMTLTLNVYIAFNVTDNQENDKIEAKTDKTEHENGKSVKRQSQMCLRKSKTSRHVKRGWDTKIPQSSGPHVKVGDEAVHKELGDRMERAATIASSLEVEQDSATAAGLLNASRNTMDADSINFTALGIIKCWPVHLMLEIIDFLNANQIYYALTVNPNIYTSCIEQFWATSKAKTINGERQLQALVDKKKVIITEISIRSDLYLEDAGGTNCLPTATIFEDLARMWKETEVPQDETQHDDSIPIPSNDPLLNGEDRKQLTELMILCTNLQKQVLDLEKAKDAQAKETVGLKKRGRSDDAEMFDTDDLHGDEVIVDMAVGEKQEQSAKVDEREVSTGVEDSAAPTIPVTTAGEGVTATKIDEITTTSAPTTAIDEITLAQTLIEIKAAKPKAVTTAATTTTTTRPKARGVVVQEPSEFRTTTSSPQASQPSKTKDKGKAIMIEPEVPLKKKDQVALDEEMARNLEAQLQAELIEEERLARKKEEEANIALIESWENTQAMMEADRLLAERLQTREQEELTDEEKAKLFMELMEKRRKHFAALRAQEKINRPPTKTQKRNQMSIYLKHMGGYKHNQLKGRSYDEIQKLFDKEMKRVNSFVVMNTEAQEISRKKDESSSKKQKTDENEEVEVDNEAELKEHMMTVKDDDIAIDDIPLATKPPVIVEYKLIRKGIMAHYQLIRADGRIDQGLGSPSGIKAFALRNFDLEVMEFKSVHGNNEDTSLKALLAIYGVGFDWSDMAEEQVQTNMALMAFSDS